MQGKNIKYNIVDKYRINVSTKCWKMNRKYSSGMYRIYKAIKQVEQEHTSERCLKIWRCR